MKNNFDSADRKLPYEQPTFKSYGTISGVTQQAGSPLDSASNDGTTPGGVIDPADPEADTHDGNTVVSD